MTWWGLEQESRIWAEISVEAPFISESFHRNDTEWCLCWNTSSQI